MQRPKVLQVSTREKAVTVEVRIGNQKLGAILDTEAKPSVIDMGTVRMLGLEREVIPTASRVYGLGNNPVNVSGYVDVEVKVGTLKPVFERIQVLDSAEPTLLLGKEFMGHFGPVTFDWEKGRVKLGHSWVPAQSLLSQRTWSCSP